MPFVTRKSLLTLSVLSGLAVAGAAGFVWSGVYNVGADDHHTRPVSALMEALRERSIQARASRLQVPALDDPARITQGAGNYDAMCTGCHLTPGVAETELSKGLYPAPPNLTRAAVNASEAFWVIKHGVKASGMPAWGMSMDDEYIWNMVAFLQELPKLDAEQYQALVDRSGGHSHGGGETEAHAHAEGVPDDHGDAPATGKPAGEAKPHPHPPGTPADHHKPTAAKPTPKPAPDMVEHRHADGTVESHPAPQPTRADDGHDHQH